MSQCHWNIKRRRPIFGNLPVSQTVVYYRTKVKSERLAVCFRETTDGPRFEFGEMVSSNMKLGSKADLDKPETDEISGKNMEVRRILQDFPSNQ